MKRIISLAIIFCALQLPGFAQDFHFHSIDPFGIQPIKEDSSRVSQKLMWFDFDQDDDLDLFMTGIDSLGDGLESWEDLYYFIEWQENIGDKWNPQFGDRMSLSGNFPFPLGYFFPTIGDLNDDNQPDFIIFGLVDHIGNRTSTYVRSTGMGHNFETTRLDEMGLPDFVPESFFIPELIDLDMDGDLDLLMSGFDPAFAEEDGPDVPVYYYAKNIGTPADPEFLGWFDDPYNLVPNSLVEILTGGDIDNDGDVDLIGPGLLIPPDSINYLYVHLNNPGVDEKPAFNDVLESPFGLPVLHGEDQFLFPSLVDIDGDGDLDLFVFELTANGQTLKYFENSLCTGIVNEVNVNLCEGESLTIGKNTYTESGEYTITFKGSDRCDSTILLSIELLPIYTVSHTENICAGESFVIGNETFTEEGDYTIYMVAENGCDSIVLLSLFVHELDNSVTLQGNTLTANAPFASYQWFNCDSGENIPGATHQTYDVLTTGNYAVNLTDGFGCSAVSPCFLVVVTAFQEDIISNAITIYPNPTQGLIYLNNESQFPISGIVVTNLFGRMVGEFITDGKDPIDIGNFGKGVFFIKIKIKGREVIKKLAVF